MGPGAAQDPGPDARAGRGTESREHIRTEPRVPLERRLERTVEPERSAFGHRVRPRLRGVIRALIACRHLRGRRGPKPVPRRRQARAPSGGAAR